MPGFAPHGAAPIGALPEAAAGASVEVVVSDDLVLTSSTETEVGLAMSLVADGLVLAMTAGTSELSPVTSGLLMADDASALAKRIAEIADTLVLQDTTRVLLEAILSDSVVFDAALIGDRLVVAALVDSLQLLGTAIDTLSAMADVADVLTLIDTLRSLAEANVTDPLVVQDALIAGYAAMAELVSAAVFDDALESSMVLTVLLDESVAFDDDAATHVTWVTAIHDGLALSISLAIDGVAYVGLALNTANKGVTDYINFDLNSLAFFNGHLYGADDAGLYLMEGATDAGAAIAAHVRTGLTRPGRGKELQVPSAYLGYRSNGSLQLKVVTTGAGGRKVGYVYDLVQQNAVDARAGRVKFGRGLKSAYWTFELANIAGADFDLDVIDLLPITLSRRLP